MQISFPSVERSLKSIHSWMGVFILPWVIIIGLTGIYLNHYGTISAWMEVPSYDERQFDSSHLAHEATQAEALAIAQAAWPRENFHLSSQDSYHDRSTWVYRSDRGRVIVDKATGFYWLRTDFRRQTFAPDGTQVHNKYYWGVLFKTLHERGWATNTFGTWLADITGGALAVFGLTGIYLFVAPRLRRRKNRRARMKMAQG